VIEIRALKALALHAAGDHDGSLTVVAEGPRTGPAGGLRARLRRRGELCPRMSTG
jgi:hypothetical protein